MLLIHHVRGLGPAGRSLLEGDRQEHPDSAYEKYPEATQPLGFEGVEALENITRSLMSRAREAVLEGVKA